MKVFCKKCIPEIGQRLRILREKKGFSVNYFAYGYDLSPATVSRVENGDTILTYSTLMKYVIALDVPLEYILKGIQYIEDVDV